MPVARAFLGLFALFGTVISDPDVCSSDDCTDAADESHAMFQKSRYQKRSAATTTDPVDADYYDQANTLLQSEGDKKENSDRKQTKEKSKSKVQDDWQSAWIAEIGDEKIGMDILRNLMNDVGDCQSNKKCDKFGAMNDAYKEMLGLGSYNWPSRTYAHDFVEFLETQDLDNQMALLDAYKAYKGDKTKPNYDLGYADARDITKYWGNQLLRVRQEQAYDAGWQDAKNDR